MKRYLTAALAILTLAICTAGKYGLKDATVRFKVVDDQGQPVTNAHVVAYSLSNHKGEGKTNEQGEFAYFARSIYPPLSGKVLKEGYYRTRGVVWRGPFGEAPAETLSVVLKRIIDPVPMVRKEVEMLFPVLGEPVGFDFEVGDWVVPHGAGKVADAWIVGTYEYRTTDDFSLGATLAAVNLLDGFISFPVLRMDNSDIVRSDFQPPHAAPESSYASRIEAFRRTLPSNCREDSYDRGVDYLFRLRTVVDDQGNVLQAHVGWLSDGIQMTLNDDPRVTNEANHLRISFSYYYNTDPHSRSLEPKEIADRQGR